MMVSLLGHIGHGNAAGAERTALHIDGEGVFLSERDGDDAKLLGVYSSHAWAGAPVGRGQPGLERPWRQ
ncbi:hypothetical protein [Streptomyces sp. NPDC004042]|uniref:hypothetical protein n=1 Tax=Streptomyces sp. NPDC004042 TaxID=3154451 RepID=UPI0033B07C8B